MIAQANTVTRLAVLLLLALVAVVAAADDSARHITVAYALACQTPEGYRRILDVKDSGDQAALQKLLALAAETNLCITMRKGDVVYLEDVKVWRGMAQVRKRGEIALWWVDLGHIDK